MHPRAVGVLASRGHATFLRRLQSLNPLCHKDVRKSRPKFHPHVLEKTRYFEQTLAGQVIHDTVEEKSLREVKEKLAALGLTLGMTLDDDVYSAAVVATVAESLRAREG
jgi:hypothetical protein